MEFRNKFMNDISCNSFTLAIGMIGDAHKKSLLEHCEFEILEDMESVYKYTLTI